jgi:hypothetical protein
VDDIVGVVDRETIYNEIKGYLHTYSSLDNKTYLEVMGKYIMAVDLNGVGNPNRRTFEILLTNTLLISQKNKLVWPFEEQFDENTIFENKEDFISKINKFNTDVSIYLTAKQKQDYIFNRYFNKEWLRNYILSKSINSMQNNKRVGRRNDTPDFYIDEIYPLFKYNSVISILSCR